MPCPCAAVVHWTCYYGHRSTRSSFNPTVSSANADSQSASNAISNLVDQSAPNAVSTAQAANTISTAEAPNSASMSSDATADKPQVAETELSKADTGTSDEAQTSAVTCIEMQNPWRCDFCHSMTLLQHSAHSNNGISRASAQSSSAAMDVDTEIGQISPTTNTDSIAVVLPATAAATSAVHGAHALGGVTGTQQLRYSEPVCAMCPCSGGPLKATTDGTWVHALCCGLGVAGAVFVQPTAQTTGNKTDDATAATPAATTTITAGNGHGGDD